MTGPPPANAGVPTSITAPAGASAAFAIAGATAVLRHLLRRAVVDGDLAAVLGAAVSVTALPPEDERRDGPAAAARLHVALVDVAPSAGAHAAALPPRDAGGAPRPAAPLALDLRYLVSAHAAAELHAEIALGHAMQALHGHPVPTPDEIRAAIAPPPEGAPAPPAERALAASGLAERVARIRIAQQAASGEELAHLWTATRAARRPCALYVVGVTLR